MVEKTPDKDAKINSVYQKFKDCFNKVIMTLYHYETSEEIPNKNLNQSYIIQKKLPSIKINTAQLTLMLVLSFTKHSLQKGKNNFVRQQILFKNWRFDKLSFFLQLKNQQEIFEQWEPQFIQIQKL
ncbi:unnamed protein product [Paramecium pentaurelia]|uniref:Uncharacterized protein n=1 Tax=Paramecium pentaurelia TaxID=43138 RepID=A0A8S1YA93_9CILI|nr:unnamed protein product [Paramecium pentaurelia]